MRVGVIAEGWTDVAVLRSIIKTVLGLDAFEVDSLRPELQSDETALHAPPAAAFSNWAIVREECNALGARDADSRIANYLGSPVEEERLVIIHVDTAEWGFEIARPPKASPSYVVDCCDAARATLRMWTAGAYDDRLAFAVAVEEIEAWLLCLYDDKLHPGDDTGFRPDPKRTLDVLLNRRLSNKRDRELLLRDPSDQRRYAALSAPLRKPKELERAQAFNASLRAFVEQLRHTAESISPKASAE